MATMTARDEAAKEQIIRKLRSEGYPTYARLFDLFDLNLTDNPDVVGYMLPGKAKIVLNENLSIDQVSTIVRHEILHEWLSHGSRSEKFDKEHPDLLPDHDTSNIAADYEISNVGYTDKDKRAARAIILGDKTLQGLVTEDQYPGWEDKSFEEMYEELLKQNLEEKKQLLNLLKQLHKMLPEDEDDQNQSQPSGTPSDPNSDDNSSENQNSGTSSSDSSEAQSGDQQGQEQSKADKAQQALDDAKDDIKDIDKEKAQQGNVFDSDEQQKERSELAKRVEQIRKLLDDPDIQRQGKGESQRAVQKDRLIKQAKLADRYKSNPLVKFTLDLNNFIKQQTANYRGSTWTRFNKTSVRTGLIKPGITSYAQTDIPEINVYWDVSGSFSNPAKTEGARRAIATLQKYVREKKIKIKTWYFADRVSSTEENAGGGTKGQPILDHIQATKPANVIVITDSDISDCRTPTTVPGAVWLLFYGSESPNLRAYLRGKQETKSYLIYDY
jgi:predicted metal-dependent peptidase|nr:MAG TPA: Putative metallopeptidase domain protein [Caudoviricetes sp.]